MGTYDNSVFPFLDFEEGAAPATPASGVVRVYPKADGLMYSKDDAGAESAFGGDVSAHTGDTTDAHDASAISFAPAGSIAATDVQAAIEEVAAEAGGAPPDCYMGGPITSPVTMTNAAQWYDSGAQVVLPGGDYEFKGQAVIRVANAGATSVMVRLIDTEGSPTTYTGGQMSVPANAGQEVTVPIRPHVATLPGTRTLKLQCQDGFRASSVIVDTGTSVSPGTDIVTGFTALAVTAA